MPAAEPGSDPAPHLSRTRSSGCVSLKREMSVLDDDLVEPVIRELDVLKNMLAAVMEVSPRGAQFERLLSRADAQVGNANSAVTKLHALEEKLARNTRMLDDIVVHCNTLQISAKTDPGSVAKTLLLVRTLVDEVRKYHNTMDFIETTVINISTELARMSLRQEKIIRVLETWEGSREEISRTEKHVKSIHEILLMIGNHDTE